MRDWILGLQKAALEHRAGVTDAEWTAAMTESRIDAPDELRDFYLQLNGASFASGVVLFALRGTGEVKGVLEQSRTGAGGLPADDVWRIGRRDQEHLAAVRKARLTEIDQAEASAPPDWLESAPDEAWVFVARDEKTNGLRIYPTLERLLTSRIPPAESEDFGDRTFARAMSLVENALDGIGTTARTGVAKLKAGLKRAVKRKSARKNKKSAAARKPRAAKRPAKAGKKPIKKSRTPAKAAGKKKQRPLRAGSKAKSGGPSSRSTRRGR